MSAGLSYFWQSLAAQSPTILVCAIGTVAAIVMMRRWSAAASLVLVALGVMLATILGTTLFQSLMIGRMQTGQVDPRSYGQTMMVVSVLGNLARGASLAILVCAVFTGRDLGRVKSEG